MGSRVLVYHGDADPAEDLPLASLYTTGYRFAVPWPGIWRDYLEREPLRSISDAYSEARGPDGRLTQPGDPSSEQYPSLREWERAVFPVWSARLVEALRRRGLIGVPQGYWVHLKPTTARFRFRHGYIVAHPTPRRGPANRTRRVLVSTESRSTLRESVDERRARVPAESLASFDMVVCAFGGFPPPEAYWPVIALLGARLPFRALAEMLCLLFDQDWAVAFNDAMAKGSVPAPPREVEAARQRLLRCGYDEWLRRPYSSAS